VENKRERFLSLFKEYESRIYNFIYRMTRNEADAEELTQEAFIKIWEGLDGLREDSSINSWAYRIAYDTCSISFAGIRRNLNRSL